MRVCPINCVPRTVVCSTVQNKIHETAPRPAENSGNSLSFKGIRWGTIGGLVGAFAGIGIGAVATVATGGLIVPLIAGVAGGTAGSIGGDMLDAKYNPNYPKKDDDDDGESYYNNEY